MADYLRLETVGALTLEGATAPPATDPTDALQVAVFELLGGDDALTALITGVYDSPPEHARRDYVVIGEMMSSPDGAHDGEGRQTALVLHTWTEADSFKSANDIGARLVALLWHRHADLDAVMDGHTVWRIDHEFAQTLVDPQPRIRHRVDRFRVWTQEDTT